MHLPGKSARKNRAPGKEHPIRTLFDTYEEWHAFIIGFCEVLCPWPASFKINRSVKKSLAPEYHYYAAGRGCGLVALLGVIILAKKLLWR